MGITDVLLVMITALLGLCAYFMARMVRQFDRMESDLRGMQKSLERFRRNVARVLDMDWLADDEAPTPIPERNKRA